MHPQTAAGLYLCFVTSLGVVSLFIWLAAFRLRWRDATILPYQPSPPVPWGPIGLALAGFLLLLQVTNQLVGEDADEASPDQIVTALLQWAGIELVLSAAILMVLVIVYRATRADLGLPIGIRDSAEDATLGVLAALASLAPVYLVLYGCIRAFGQRPQNPLLEDLLQEPTSAMFAAAAAAAIVAAPLFEELIYRLLVQGWLEKVLARPNMPAESAEGRVNWLPIVISSALFAAAHFGIEYGYSPIPLFLLAIVLGYIYQRTHRIVPCIVAHMVFNGITIVLMWLQIQASKGQPGL